MKKLYLDRSIEIYKKNIRKALITCFPFFMSSLILKPIFRHFETSLRNKGSIKDLLYQGSCAPGEFPFILQKYLSSVPFYKCLRYFPSYQILSIRTNLQKRPLPASGQDVQKFSSVKTVRFYNLQTFL